MQRGKAEGPFYRLETRFSIIETDSEGRWLGNNRFELQDSQQLPQLPLESLLAIMGNLHSAFKGIADITHTE